MSSPSANCPERHFQSQEVRQGLKKHTVSGGFVAGGAQIAKFLLSLGSTLVMARLLDAGDFGLLTMVTTVVGFFGVFRDAGLSLATIQRENITHAQVSNLFWMNVAISTGICLILVVLSPLLGRIYGDPRLVGITCMLAMTFILTGLTAQHLAILNRQMRFGVVASIEILSIVLSVTTGVVLAYLGYGYWSLVWSNVSLGLASCILTWSFTSWRPGLPNRAVETRSLVVFGANMTFASFLHYLSRSCDNLLIGGVYGTEAVGHYSRGAVLLMKPLEQMVSPISSVFVPALSRLQNEPDRYRRVFLSIYEVIALGGFVFTGVVLALSDPIVMVLLGQKWKDVVPVFASYAVAGIYVPLASAAMWLMQSQARGGDTLKIISVLSAISVTSFVVGLPFGAAGVALAYSTTGLCVRMPLLYRAAGRTGPVRTRDLWTVFFKHLPVCAVVCFSCYGVNYLLAGQMNVVRLISAALGGCGIGALYIYLVPAHRHVIIRLLTTLQEFRKSPK